MTGTPKTISSSFHRQSETWLSIAFLLTLGVLIVPLPTFVLDMFLAANLTMAILLLLITLNAKRPLDVSVFPSLLLLMTLFRLALNVATTRVILLNGNAGSIVDAFGDLVVGGNLIVGCVIFLILVTIQFIVITKGATRISEVNARFTLDSMPGKQMAIDAELNVGAIDEVQARKRREDLSAESEFFGAMDGASKYVRGDAIAGLIIMAVNILGGVVLGMTNGQTIGDAVQIYSLLTIGDGLVSQIPALIIASSAGVLVTKSSSESNLGQEISSQVLLGHRALVTGAIVLLFVAMVPGFPKLPFLGLSAAIFMFLHFGKNKDVPAESVEETQESLEAAAAVSPDEANLENFLQQDRIVVEIGAGLIGLVDPKDGKGIVSRVATLRKEIGSQFGFWIPNIRIQDNLKIDVMAYNIKIGGRTVGASEIYPKEFLAINPGTLSTEIEGRETEDPAFGLAAKWVTEGNRRRAEISGYTVVDATTVMTTHLGECLKKHAHELLSREDLQKMLSKLKEVAPTIVAEIKPDGISAGTLHQVLIRLLMESVSISSLEKIVESCSHYASSNQSILGLTELVRSDIGAVIVEKYRDAVGRVNVILLEPKLEHRLRECLSGELIALSPEQMENLVEKLKSSWELGSMKNQTPALLLDGSIRAATRQTIRRSLPQLSVISYTEVPTDLQIEPIAVVGSEDVFGNEPQVTPLPVQSQPATNGIPSQEQLV